MQYRLYESRHKETVGKGNAHDWNYTSMTRIYDAYSDAQLSNEWN